MAEGTRLKDLSEHITVLEGRMQKLTTKYHSKVNELANQITEVKEVEQRHYEGLQREATARYESILKDNASRHEELLNLLANQQNLLNLPCSSIHHHIHTNTPVIHPLVTIFH